MVDPSDIIYTSCGSQIKLLGSGFESEEDIVETIKDKYEEPIKSGKNVEFGICDLTELGDSDSYDISYVIPHNLVPLSDTEEEELQSLLSHAESDTRVKDARKVRDHTVEEVQLKRHTSTIQRYKNTVRYNYAIDFRITIDETKFESHPIESTHEVVDSIISDIFNKYAADYLGITTGYAKRGNKDPYTHMYGRVHRDTEKERQFREIVQEDSVIGQYWGDKNLTPIPIYYNSSLSSSYGNAEQDYILVIDETSEETGFDELQKDAVEKVSELQNKIESLYKYRFDWIGKMRHQTNHDQVVVGISYVGEPERTGKHIIP